MLAHTSYKINELTWGSLPFCHKCRKDTGRGVDCRQRVGVGSVHRGGGAGRLSVIGHCEPLDTEALGGAKERRHLSLGNVDLALNKYE